MACSWAEYDTSAEAFLLLEPSAVIESPTQLTLMCAAVVVTVMAHSNAADTAGEGMFGAIVVYYSVLWW